MRKYRFGFMCSTAALLVAFMIGGCGQETVTLPGVVSVTPAQGATDVAVGATISATFSQAMKAASINTTTFTVVAPGGVAVGGAVTYTGLVATFTPTGGTLAYGTTYTATITDAATTSGGAGLIGNYTWSFTTAAIPLPPAPTVTVTAPVSSPENLNVPFNQVVTATFSEPMAPDTIIGANFTLTVQGSPTLVSGSVSYVGPGNELVFQLSPGVFLQPSTTYTATITTGVTDVAGTAMANAYTWNFMTAAAPLLPVPTVTSTDPVSTPENLNVPLNQVVTATFSGPMAPDTIIGANFTLTVQGSPTLVSGSVSYVGPGNKLVFQLSPDVFLQPSTTYTATITTGVTDVAGTPMANPYTWNFMTTAAGVNNTQPVLVSTFPTDGALDVCQNPAVSATFSEAMNQATFTSSTFYIYLSTDLTKTPIAGSYSYNATNFIETFTPTNPLTADTGYTATVTDGATDMFGIGLLVSATGPPPNPWTFTVGTSMCQPPVNLGVLAPFGAAGGAGGMTNTGAETVVNGEIATTASASVVTGFYDQHDSTAPGVYPCNYTAGAGANYGLVQNGTTPPGIAIFTAPGPPNGACSDEGTGTATTGTFGIATAAEAQALATYNSLQSSTNPSSGTTPSAPQGSNTLVTGVDLGGETLYPGVYWAASTVDITSGDLTLDAQGDPTATFVFQIGSALTVGGTAPRNIILAHGAQASNIFWLCASAATINGAGGGTFNGTVIANATISTGTPGITTITTINGRLISLGLSSPSSSTTLVNTVINVPAP